MLQAPNLAALPWLIHGFGWRDSEYPVEITTLKQIHSAKVIDAAGRRGDRIEEGDALISDTPGLAIGVRTADCVPVLLADVRLRTIAAIHAGWRGTAAQIVLSSVRQMSKVFGTRAEDLVSAIGPCIGPCCYEVGPEVAHQFVTWYPELERTVSPVRLNLPGANAKQLSNAGVTDIFVSGECTFCSPGRYHSYRRDKDAAGRLLSFAGLKNVA
jgi:YfiH family protein